MDGTCFNLYAALLNCTHTLYAAHVFLIKLYILLKCCNYGYIIARNIIKTRLQRSCNILYGI